MVAENETIEIPAPKKRSRSLVIGYALLGLHVVTWYPGAILVPLLPIRLGLRAAIAAGMIAVGEIAFWASLPFLGKELATKYRRYLNPLNWFRRRNVPHPESAPDGEE